MTSNLPGRAPLQGLIQIFRYNRPFYVRTAGAALATLVVAQYLPAPVRKLALLAAVLVAFWTCSSLVVSHYIYDRSELYEFSCLRESVSRPPTRWMNIHAGLDESSLAIRSIFPGSDGQMVDIYDPHKMTEGSIERARCIAAVAPPRVNAERLPAPDNHVDAAFLIFAAHELRNAGDRVALFREVARVLGGEGELVLMEHLRDWVNFLAFGPGFLHFFSKHTWVAAASSAGFSIIRHSTVTPFVHVFVLRKQP